MNKRLIKRLLIGEFTGWRLVCSMLQIAVLIYLGMLAYLYFFSDQLIFRPPPPSYRDTPQTLKLQTTGGTQISAVYLPNPRATYTILFSHGNAEDLGHLTPMLEAFRRMGFSVLAYDYQGYGTSGGTPSERRAYQDITATYDYATNELHIPPQRLIAYGRSLGGAVAVDLASRKPLAGLILESTFVTAWRVVTRVPIFPFDKFKSIEKIKRVQCPVLVMHGQRDEIISFWHGAALFKQAPEPKMFLWVENAAHNDLFEKAGEKFDQALQSFSRLCLTGQSYNLDFVNDSQVNQALTHYVKTGDED